MHCIHTHGVVYFGSRVCRIASFRPRANRKTTHTHTAVSSASSSSFSLLSIAIVRGHLGAHTRDDVTTHHQPTPANDTTRAIRTPTERSVELLVSNPKPESGGLIVDVQSSDKYRVEYAQHTLHMHTHTHTNTSATHRCLFVIVSATSFRGTCFIYKLIYSYIIHYQKKTTNRITYTRYVCDYIVGDARTHSHIHILNTLRSKAAAAKKSLECIHKQQTRVRVRVCT